MWNPQENSMIEYVIQDPGNIICVFETQNIYLDGNYP